MPENAESLPPEIQLALAYTPVPFRDRLQILFSLDQRLARIAAATTEPILGQMRLAWWRDMLRTSVESRPKGDAVLDSIGEYWEGDGKDLTSLVDAWEVLVASEALRENDFSSIASGRSAPFGKLLSEARPDTETRIAAAAMSWVYADLAGRLSDRDERELAISQGLALDVADNRLPKSARGMGVLEALAKRALRRGGKPLMEGRGASIVALKAGILGR